MLNLPTHIHCQSCGACCGPIPITTNDYATILDYCKTNNITLKPEEARDKLNELTCPFRDNEKKICMIYPVRPYVCKIFGVAGGMNCVNGNTFNLSMEHLINLNPDKNMPHLMHYMDLLKELIK